MTAYFIAATGIKVIYIYNKQNEKSKCRLIFIKYYREPKKTEKSLKNYNIIHYGIISLIV